MRQTDSSRITSAMLLRQWLGMLIAFVIILGGLSWYVLSIPARYASDSVVAFQPQPGRSDGRDLISLLIQTYPELVASERSVESAARAAGVSPAELRSGLDVQIPPLTLNMTIETQLSDPRKAQLANQSLVDTVIEQGQKDPYVVATAVSNADLNDAPSGTSRSLLLLVSVVLAAGAALLVGILLARVRGSAGTHGGEE